MKIVIDARLYGLENAGLGRYVINLIKQLSKIDKKNNYVIFLRKKYFIKLKLPSNWKKVLTDFRHYSLKEQILLPLYLNKEKANLVHFPHFNIPLFYFGNYVVTIHDLLMHKFKGKEVTTRDTSIYTLKRLAYKIVFNRAVKKAIKILVPSQTVKNELINYYHMSPNKVMVTYEGIDMGMFNLDLESDTVLNEYQIKKPYLIYIGNAYPHKNLDKAIEAVKLFNSRNSQNLSFVIISSRNVFVKRLIAKVRELGISDFVKVLNFIADKKLGILLKNSLGFIYPSLSEGFGLQGLESIASGTLVLASDIPIFREIYKDNVIYFNPTDIESIFKAIERVFLMKQDQRRILIENGKNFIKKYSWFKMAEETLKIYESCSSLRSSQ